MLWTVVVKDGNLQREIKNEANWKWNVKYSEKKVKGLFDYKERKVSTYWCINYLRCIYIWTAVESRTKINVFRQNPI